MTKQPRRILLASTSPYRRELVARLGLPIEVASPAYDEPSLDEPPEKLVMAHAEAKARSLIRKFPDALIIGSDQLAEFDGQPLGKPGDAARAEAQLAMLAGHTHRLLTATCVLDSKSGRIEKDLSIYQMTIRPLSDEQIRHYVARDNPIDCAGSYKLESLGIALFSQIEGMDETGVQGMPLTRLVDILGRFGVDPLGN